MKEKILILLSLFLFSVHSLNCYNTLMGEICVVVDLFGNVINFQPGQHFGRDGNGNGNVNRMKGYDNRRMKMNGRGDEEINDFKKFNHFEEPFDADDYENELFESHQHVHQQMPRGYQGDSNHANYYSYSTKPSYPSHHKHCRSSQAYVEDEMDGEEEIKRIKRQLYTNRINHIKNNQKTKHPNSPTTKNQQKIPTNINKFANKKIAEKIKMRGLHNGINLKFFFLQSKKSFDGTHIKATNENESRNSHLNKENLSKDKFDKRTFHSKKEDQQKNNSHKREKSIPSKPKIRSNDSKNRIDSKFRKYSPRHTSTIHHDQNIFAGQSFTDYNSHRSKRDSNFYPRKNKFKRRKKINRFANPKFSNNKRSTLFYPLHFLKMKSRRELITTIKKAKHEKNSPPNLFGDQISFHSNPRNSKPYSIHSSSLQSNEKQSPHRKKNHQPNARHTRKKTELEKERFFFSFSKNKEIIF